MTGKLVILGLVGLCLFGVSANEGGQIRDFLKLQDSKALNDDADVTNAQSIEKPVCEIRGKIFMEGQLVLGVGVGGPCEPCFCYGGAIKCSSTTCESSPEPGCKPVMEKGRCCPVRYDCDGTFDEEEQQRLTGLRARNAGEVGSDVVVVEDKKTTKRKLRLNTRRKFRRPTVTKRRRIKQRTSSTTTEPISSSILSTEPTITKEQNAKLAAAPQQTKRVTLKRTQSRFTSPLHRNRPTRINRTRLHSSRKPARRQGFLAKSTASTTSEPTTQEPGLETTVFMSLRDNEEETTTVVPIITQAEEETELPEIVDLHTLFSKISTINRASLFTTPKTILSNSDQLQHLEVINRRDRKKKNNANDTVKSNKENEIVPPEPEPATDHDQEEMTTVAPSDEKPLRNRETGFENLQTAPDYTDFDSTTETEPIDEIEVTETNPLAATESPVSKVEAKNDIITSDITGFADTKDVFEVTVKSSLHSDATNTGVAVLGEGKVSPVVLKKEHKSPETSVPKKPEPAEGTSILSALFSMLTSGERRRPPPPRGTVLRRNNKTRPVVIPQRKKDSKPFSLQRPRPSRPFLRPNRPNKINAKIDASQPVEGTVVGTSFNIKPNLQSPPKNTKEEIDKAALPPFSLLPTKPIIETNFKGIPNDAETFETLTEDVDVDDEPSTPTLPPSLPNIRVIPFRASDAVVNKQESQDKTIDQETSQNHRVNNIDEPDRAPQSPFRRPLIPKIPSRRKPTIVRTTEKPLVTTRKAIRPIGPFRQRPSDNKDNHDNTKDSSSNVKSKRPDIAFFSRNKNRTGNRPPIIPPRRNSDKTRFTPRPTTEAKETTTVTEESVFNDVVEDATSVFPSFNTQKPIHPASLKPINNKPIHPASLRPNLFALKPTSSPTTEETRLPTIQVEETTKSIFDQIFNNNDKENDILSFLSGNMKDGNLLPKPITTSSIHSDDIANLLLQDKFDMPSIGRPPVKFSLLPTTDLSTKPKRTTTPLPEIPDEVKAQLPLGNDPILASGLLELAGCNVYGRMYEVNQKITDLESECKQCRCTPVGVQCLPTC